tara:strand:+ start:217 stop:1188 length:972 start_codon:yes stop_codon:yes gene_type:complete
MKYQIKNFLGSDIEFNDLVRIKNLVNHDHIIHVDDVKKEWFQRDKKLISHKILLYDKMILIGYLSYEQGRDENSRTCFFDIKLDPKFNQKGLRKLLYEEMLKCVKEFNCTKFTTSLFQHLNYYEYEQFLKNNNFKIGQVNFESSCDISNFDINRYSEFMNQLLSHGFIFYDSKNEMKDFPNHYKKLEKLIWTCSKDIPIPDGIIHTREPYEEYIKDQIDYEDNYYGTEVVCVKDGEYIGSTNLCVFPKSEPNKAWTGSLGVLRKYRRMGIATGLKIKVIEFLMKKGIKEIRTDNEENNPMYHINVALGFKPEPSSLDYVKIIT